MDIYQFAHSVGRYFNSFASSHGVTASIGVILYKEGFMTLKTDILVLRLDRFPFQGFPADE